MTRLHSESKRDASAPMAPIGAARRPDRRARARRHPWANLFVLAAALVSALALRWRPLTEPIWYDEWCRTSQWLNAANLPLILWRDVHNPLYNALMYVWIGALGDSELSIRLPSLLVGLASVAVFGAWACRRFGRAVGATTAAWLLTSPVHIWWSCEAKNVIFVASWAMLALVAFDALGRRPGRARWAIATLTAAGALWTDFITLAAILPAAACALAPQADRPANASSGATQSDAPTPLPRTHPRNIPRPTWWVLSAVALAAATTVPLALFKAAHTGDLPRDYLQPFALYDAAMLVLGHYLCGDAIFPESRQREYLAMALAVPALLILGRGWWRALRTPSARAAAIVLALVPLAFLAATPIIHALWNDNLHYIFQPRNTIVMLGPFALILSLGCHSLPRRRGRIVASMFFIALNVTAAVLMQTLYADRPTVMTPAGRYDDAARMIAADARSRSVQPAQAPPEIRVFAKTHPHPLSYYEPTLHTSTSWGGPPDYERIAASLRDGVPVYFLDTTDFAPLSPEEETKLRAIARMVLVGKAGAMHAYRLDPLR